jgi:hypothetical protein
MKRTSQADLPMVIEEDPNLNQIYPLIDKPYYVDVLKYKIE